MNWKKKLLALGLSLAMVLSLAACGQKAAEEEPAEQPAQTEEPAAETPDFTPAAFKIAALKGPTAMGLVELMSLSDRMLILCGGKCSGEVTDVAAATEEEIGLLMGGITHSGEGGESA